MTNHFKLNMPEYSFLRENPHLGSNIILLGLSGSHGYGTNVEGSDFDYRGVALNTPNEILTLSPTFEQVVDNTTDTTIYSFNRIIKLLSDINPNVIELLGLEPWQYAYLSPMGQELVDNRHLFLSKKAVKTFGGYANQQLYRLNQLCKHSMPQKELEEHILRTMKFTMDQFPTHFKEFEGVLNLYIGESERENLDTEIYMDVNLKGYPLRDYCGMWSELKQIATSYNKVGQRNSKAMEHGKIAKHMMHLVRLYLMCFDILEKEEIITYRRDDMDFLMEIRNGKYIDEDNQVKPEFFAIVKKLEAHLGEAARKSKLPDKPDYKAINDFVVSVNRRVILGNS